MKDMFISTRSHVLSAVVSAGSLAGAARLLGITQPAVAKHIKRLELAAGEPLFRRAGKGLEFTSLCLELADTAERMVVLENRAIDLVTRRRSTVNGQLTVALGNSTSGLDIISAFRRAFPSMRLRVEFGSYDFIVKSVLNRTSDVGLLACLPRDDRFICQPAALHSVVALVPRTLAIAQQTIVDMDTLSRHDLVFRYHGSLTQKLVDAGFRSLGLAPKPSITMDSAGGVCEAVRRDFGIGFAWRASVTQPYDFGILPIKELRATYEEMAFRLRDTESVVGDAFLSLVRDRYSGNPSIV